MLTDGVASGQLTCNSRNPRRPPAATCLPRLSSSMCPADAHLPFFTLALGCLHLIFLLQVSGFNVPLPGYAAEVNATQRTLYFTFTNDAGLQGAGIRIAVDAVPPLPTGLVHICPPWTNRAKHSDAIVGPSSPLLITTNMVSEYPPSATCTLLINIDAPEGWAIRLRPVAIYSEDGTDLLTAYDGANASTLVAIVLGGTIPPLPRAYHTSVNGTQRSMFFRFVSDGVNQYSGIRVLAEAVPPMPRSIYMFCPSGSNVNTPRVSELVVWPDTPVLIVTNWVTSEYAPQTQCKVTVLPPSGCTLGFIPQWVSSEAGYDILSIYNGPLITSPLLTQMSGTTVPGPVNATSSTVLVKFGCDAGLQGSGIRVLATAYCGSQVLSPSASSTPSISASFSSSAAATPSQVSGSATPSNSVSSSLAPSASTSPSMPATASQTAASTVSPSMAATASQTAVSTVSPSMAGSTSGTALPTISNSVLPSSTGSASASPSMVSATPTTSPQPLSICGAGANRVANATLSLGGSLTVTTNTGSNYQASSQCDLTLSLPPDAPAGWTIRIRPISIASEACCDVLSAYAGTDASAPVAMQVRPTRLQLVLLYSRPRSAMLK